MLSCKGKKTCFSGCFSPYPNGVGSSFLYGAFQALQKPLGGFLPRYNIRTPVFVTNGPNQNAFLYQPTSQKDADTANRLPPSNRLFIRDSLFREISFRYVRQGAAHPLKPL